MRGNRAVDDQEATRGNLKGSLVGQGGRAAAVSAFLALAARRLLATAFVVARHGSLGPSNGLAAIHEVLCFLQVSPRLTGPRAGSLCEPAGGWVGRWGRFDQLFVTACPHAPLHPSTRSPLLPFPPGPCPIQALAYCVNTLPGSPWVGQPVVHGAATAVGALAALNTNAAYETLVSGAAFAWVPLVAGVYILCAASYHRERQSGLLPVKVCAIGAGRTLDLPLGAGRALAECWGIPLQPPPCQGSNSLMFLSVATAKPRLPRPPPPSSTHPRIRSVHYPYDI
jgi:hypothetical protein